MLSIAPFSLSVWRDSYVFEISFLYLFLVLGVSGLALRAASAFLAVVYASMFPVLRFSVGGRALPLDSWFLPWLLHEALPRLGRRRK